MSARHCGHPKRRGAFRHCERFPALQCVPVYKPHFSQLSGRSLGAYDGHLAIQFFSDQLIEMVTVHM
jgi:hypothetical protein